MSLAQDLLKQGLTDIIDLSWMAQVARMHSIQQPDEIRKAVLCSLAKMLTSGWIILGDAVVEGDLVIVRPWNVSPADALSRIRQEWDALAELRPGDVCWFELTEAGREAAKRAMAS